MTSKTLGNLTDADALTGTEQAYVVQSSNSRKTTTQDIADLGTSQDNMTDGTTNKNYTATEKTKLAHITVAADIDLGNAVLNTATDASSFGFVLDEDDMASDSATKVPTQQSVNQGKLQKVADRTAMKALDGSKHLAVYLMEAGREGIFNWSSSDLSTLITADAQEGLYVPPSSDTTGASGAWVRQRDNLDAKIEWFGGGTGASAATNDAAFASAAALSMVQTLVYGDGVYEIAATMTLGRDGFGIKGYAGFPVFGTTTVGTRIKWTGVSTGIVAKMADASGNDVFNNAIRDIEFDCNGCTGVGLDIVNSQWPSLENVCITNLTGIGMRTGSTAVAGTGINCCYRGFFKNVRIIVTSSGVGLYITGVSGVGNTTFCTLENVHVSHENGAAIYMNAADDMVFINCGTNRIAGGTGKSLNIDGSDATGGWVVGCTWYQFHTGTADGTATIQSIGAKARQNKIYGLSGVDDAPIVSITSGSQLFYDFLGTGYDSTTATEAPVSAMGAAKFANYLNTDAGTLDYYKETASTPALTIGGATTGITYTRQECNETRIGDTVLVNVDIILSSKGTATGAVQIGSTSYVKSSSNNAALAVYASGLTSGVGDTALMARIEGERTR